jgi:hypothetical protein
LNYGKRNLIPCRWKRQRWITRPRTRQSRERILGQQANNLHRKQQKAPEKKFIPHGIGKEVWQTATYQTIKDYIIQLMQKSLRNGKDVADSIRKMERINMTTKIPVRRISGASKADDKATEQEVLDG